MQSERVFLGDAASHWETLLTMRSEDAEYSSRPEVVLRSCSSDPYHGLSSAPAGRWWAVEMQCWLAHGLAPVVEALVEGCSKVRPDSYPGRRLVGHVADYLAVL